MDKLLDNRTSYSVIIWFCFFYTEKTIVI